ncbi:hypothetical protein HOY80DRAFT_1139490 [Tuber brumale]|nr:hypothetical protein HOY80DRAFT_1139490 [Tuber brumale]
MTYSGRQVQGPAIPCSHGVIENLAVSRNLMVVATVFAESRTTFFQIANERITNYQVELDKRKQKEAVAEGPRGGSGGCSESSDG